MRVVLQRVSHASVAVEGESVGSIGTGLLVLLGVAQGDTREDLDWLVGKISRLRVFPDEAGHMNRSLLDISGDALVVSQFTLHASTRKGNRPSFLGAAPPEEAQALYRGFAQALGEILGDSKVACGRFGANMQIDLLNDGPVTIVIDSQNRE